ncbi:hypothetical protein XU18_0965 [Perkinsela sp. CCAP 1560/4]|nr:hypothetical protein XU18_0965 [Perkinsela sp. CCAP 1560/4]|eukprot:KNH08562.1 hypothetical protein XU18_0965 [Perkinsela sp. CCAP 1560/4]
MLGRDVLGVAAVLFHHLLVGLWEGELVLAGLDWLIVLRERQAQLALTHVAKADVPEEIPTDHLLYQEIVRKRRDIWVRLRKADCESLIETGL